MYHAHRWYTHKTDRVSVFRLASYHRRRVNTWLLSLHQFVSSFCLFLYPCVSLFLLACGILVLPLSSVSPSRGIHSTADKHEGAHASLLVLKYHATTGARVLPDRTTTFSRETVTLQHHTCLLLCHRSKINAYASTFNDQFDSPCLFYRHNTGIARSHAHFGVTVTIVVTWHS